jgi:hypothetical protein
MSTLRLLPVLALLLLAACGSSSTDPGDGGGDFDLTTAFDEGDAEFEEDAAGTRVRFDGIDFGGRASSTLSPDDRLILNRFAAVFEALPTAGYPIESHTDARRRPPSPASTGSRSCSTKPTVQSRASSLRPRRSASVSTATGSGALRGRYSETRRMPVQ